MPQDIQERYQNYMLQNRRRGILKKIVHVLACTVIFCTTYALILPAITMENEAFCGIEEHIHSDACYGRTSTSRLICHGETLQVHTHSEGCYDADGSVICGQADYIAHSHDKNCYGEDGSLVCTLAERDTHVHVQSCYAPAQTQAQVLHVHSDGCYTQEQGELICGTEPYAGHTHGDGCYAPGTELTCTLTQQHVHGDECYTYPLVCTLSEESHSHTDSCYTTGDLLCTTEEGHIHGDSCMTENLDCENTAEDHVHTDVCYSRTLSCTVPENHSHSASCYESVLCCGKEAGQAHQHEASCYSQEPELVCQETENHIHSDSCYHPQLVCTIREDPGHSHGDDCYEWNAVLSCGMEEGQPEPTQPEDPVLICGEPVATVHVHGDGCFETAASDPVPICGNTEEGHVHTDACYELTCGLEVHSHSLACYSDPEADVETREDWEATLAGVELTGKWPEDVIAIAESQLGYAESSRNYAVWEDNTTHGYTRYGAWYGSPYGDWCAMFTSFCLHYAGVEGIPLHWGVRPWIEELTELKLYHDAEIYDPKPGDIIFYDWEGDDLSDHVGLVAEVMPATDVEPARIKAIEGNSSNCVQYVYYDLGDAQILGYSELPDNPEVYSCGILRHKHNEYCYDDDGNFICHQLEHEHIETCEPRDALYCGLEEHSHTDSCYGENGELACQLQEHVHTDSCTGEQPVEEMPIYYCGLEEHNHGDSCYDEAGELVCELTEHIHSGECAAEPVVYYCGFQEHAHIDSCFNEDGTQNCVLPEHTHTNACTEEPVPVTYYCGLEEHSHGDSCYDEAGELICEIIEHTHQEICTVAPVTYYCGLEEHIHGESCYDEAGTLVCEIPEHSHCGECMVEPVTYYCGLEEHTHSETCYNEAGEQACELTEHIHSDECTVQPLYLCGLEEHTHGDGCYDEAGNLTCTLAEHTHNDGCTVQGGYVCGLEAHTHDERCYDAEGNLICTLPEHTHNDSCLAQNIYACGLAEHTHGDGCYDEQGNLICTLPEHIHTAACVGRDLYYSNSSIRVHAAIRGVENLPQKLQLYVQPVIQEENPESFGGMQVAVNEKIATREQYLSTASFYELYLLSEGQIYELPETAMVTVTMEFDQPIFNADDVAQSVGTHAFMLTPEGGVQVPAALAALEEDAAEETPDATEPSQPSFVESVVNVISDTVDSILTITPAHALEGDPEEKTGGEGDSPDPTPTENSVSGDNTEDTAPAGDVLQEEPADSGSQYDVSALDSEDFGNPQQGITSVTFTTNRLATFGIALANETMTGDFWERVTDTDEITADGTYMIISAEGNYALGAESYYYYGTRYRTTSTPVTLQTVKGNVEYYTISDSNSTEIRWKVQSNGVFQNEATSRYLNVNDNSLLSNSATNHTLSYETPENCWRIRNGNYYLRNTGEGDFTRSNANDGSGKGTSGQTTTYYYTRDMLIFKLSDVTSLNIPSDVGSESTEGGSSAAGPAKPDYEDFITPSSGKTGDTAIAFDGTSVSGKYYSDPATSNLESNYRKDTYAKSEAIDGKVMTDKSVIYAGDDYDALSYGGNTFGVTLSVLGQEYPVPQTDIIRTPIDVVFVLDVSGSMSANAYQNEVRAVAVSEAFNSAVTNIMKDHPANRVGMVMFSTGAWEILPLDRYKADDTNGDGVMDLTTYTQLSKYNISNKYYVYGSSSLQTESGISYANAGRYNDINGSEIIQGVGTFTQGGIAMGEKVFRDIGGDTTYTTTIGEGEEAREYTVKRQPVFILLSDGEPTHATNVYMDALNGPFYGDGQSASNNTNAKGILGYYTILTANYSKRMVGIQYDKQALFYTIGMGIKTPTDSDNDTGYTTTYTGDRYKRAVLNPEAGIIANLSSEINGDTTTDQLKKLLLNNFNDQAVQVTSVWPDTWIGVPHRQLPALQDNPYSGNYSYANNAYFGQMTAEDLAQIFQSILQDSVEEKPYGFVLYQNTDVQLTDYIGAGMEIKGTPVLRYAGVNYTDPTVTTSGNVTTYTYHGTYQDPHNPNAKEVDLSEIRVTVTTEPVVPIYMCGQEAVSGHVHSEDTCGIYKTYLCGHHSHQAACYELICTNTSESHTHVWSCYNHDRLVCDDPHIHTDDCEEVTETQTVDMVVPDFALPVYTPELIGKQFYYEQLPVRLIYQVGLTEESTAAVLALAEHGGALTFYTNRWGGNQRAHADLVPSLVNPFYYDQNTEDGVTAVPYQPHTDSKEGNVTETAENAMECHWGSIELENRDLGHVYHEHGNNGKLTFAAETVDIPVEKVWQGVSAEDQDPVTVSVYKVAEAASESGAAQQVITQVRTAVLSSSEDPAANWKHTFEDLPMPNDSFFYVLTETVPQGFRASYSGGETMLLSLDNSAPVTVVKVTDFSETAKIVITNETSVELPNTGGSGILPYYVSGTLLCCLFCAGYVFLVQKKKIKKEVA